MKNTPTVKRQILLGLFYAALIIIFIELVGYEFKGSFIGNAIENLNLSSTHKKIGDCILKVNTDSAEISIDNFPHYDIGISDVNQVRWPSGFSFEALNRFAYIGIKSNDFIKDNVRILIRYNEQDHNGKIYPNKWILLGILNVKETKKYKDFEHWQTQNNTVGAMFWKLEGKSK